VSTESEAARGPASVAVTDGALRLSYQGWSGVVVDASHDATPLVFDPAPGTALPPGATLLLTHGHFEHVDGALAHLRRRQRPPVTVVASAPLCRYLQRHAPGRGDRFVRVAAGQELEVGGWSLRVFAWEHMTLLPPGAGSKVRYVLKLVTHPASLMKMAVGGACGPLAHSPMLGFAARAPGAAGWLVYYGEGLHRRTSPRELRSVLDAVPVETLVFGAEPEDIDALPRLLAGHAVERALAFEPHRGWRANFGLPQIDMAELVTDEILEEIAVVGPRDRVAARILERLSGIGDAVSLTNNRAPDPTHWADVVAQLRALTSREERAGSSPRQ